jgi:hypothetical protein
VKGSIPHRIAPSLRNSRILPFSKVIGRMVLSSPRPLARHWPQPKRNVNTVSSRISLSSKRVTRVLDRVSDQRGKPEVIRCDNGPEFTSRHFLVWCEEKGISLLHIHGNLPFQRLRQPCPLAEVTCSQRRGSSGDNSCRFCLNGKFLSW